MTWRVVVENDFALDGLAVKMADSHSTGLLVVEPMELVLTRHEPATYVDPKPALRLPSELARTLLDGLVHHFGGTNEVLSLRADYLHERQRVDKFIERTLR